MAWCVSWCGHGVWLGVKMVWDGVRRGEWLCGRTGGWWGVLFGALWREGGVVWGRRGGEGGVVWSFVGIKGAWCGTWCGALCEGRGVGGRRGEGGVVWG